MSRETSPLDGLPPADRTLLVNAPLETAVAEIKFLGAAAELPPQVGLRLRELLAQRGLKFARLEQSHEQRVTFEMSPGSAGAPQIQQVANGWQLVSGDGKLQVTFMPGALLIQTTSYERWSTSLRPVIKAALEVVDEILPVAVVARIGIRYIDRFVDSGARSPLAWRGRIDDSLLGPACHQLIGPRMQSAQQQIELSLGDAQGALLRHGPFVDAAAGGSVSYLLDLDVFDSEPRAFDIDEVMHFADTLNKTAATLFQATMCPGYLRELQGGEGQNAAESDARKAQDRVAR